jgi:hypothetical protein
VAVSYAVSTIAELAPCADSWIRVRGSVAGVGPKSGSVMIFVVPSVCATRWNRGIQPETRTRPGVSRQSINAWRIAPKLAITVARWCGPNTASR